MPSVMTAICPAAITSCFGFKNVTVCLKECPYPFSDHTQTVDAAAAGRRRRENRRRSSFFSCSPRRAVCGWRWIAEMPRTDGAGVSSEWGGLRRRSGASGTGRRLAAGGSSAGVAAAAGRPAVGAALGRRPALSGYQSAAATTIDPSSRPAEVAEPAWASAATTLARGYWLGGSGGRWRHRPACHHAPPAPSTGGSGWTVVVLQLLAAARLPAAARRLWMDRGVASD